MGTSVCQDPIRQRVYFTLGAELPHPGLALQGLVLPSPNLGEGSVASVQEAEQGEVRTHRAPTLKCTLRQTVYGRMNEASESASI